MEIEKIIFDDSAGRVENRDDGQVCIFMTHSGKEVLFTRDRNDNVVKSFEGRLDSADFVRARGVAGLKLGKTFLKKETYSTTKVVSAPASSPRAQAAAKVPRPAWLHQRSAAAHAEKIRPHTDDE